jgi:hypothetical protein
MKKEWTVGTIRARSGRFDKVPGVSIIPSLALRALMDEAYKPPA